MAAATTPTQVSQSAISAPSFTLTPLSSHIQVERCRSGLGYREVLPHMVCNARDAAFVRGRIRRHCSRTGLGYLECSPLLAAAQPRRAELWRESYAESNENSHYGS